MRRSRISGYLPICKVVKSCEIVHVTSAYPWWWVFPKFDENRDFWGVVTLRCCWIYAMHLSSVCIVMLILINSHFY